MNPTPVNVPLSVAVALVGVALIAWPWLARWWRGRTPLRRRSGGNPTPRRAGTCKVPPHPRPRQT